MRRGTLSVFLLAVAGCGGGAPSSPVPSDRSEIRVLVSAVPRPGVKGKRDPFFYGDGKEDPEAALAYARVDYKGMADIAVTLSGKGLGADGPAPARERLVVRAGGFDRRLILLAPEGRTEFEIENRQDRELNVFCLGRGRESDGFDVAIPARQKRSVTLRAPGVYEISCAEEPTFAAEAVVADTGQAMLVRSGRTAVFDGLPPGSYEVTVRAPRLPLWRSRIEAVAGRRIEVSATLTVGNLGSSGKE